MQRQQITPSRDAIAFRDGARTSLAVGPSSSLTKRVQERVYFTPKRIVNVK